MGRWFLRAARLRFLAACGLALAPWLAASASSTAFGFEQLSDRAKALAAAPYRKPEGGLPEALKELSYDQFREIRYRPERARWRNAGLPFELQFFHPGRYFTETVRIHEIAQDGVRDFRYDPDAFDYGSNRIDTSKLQGIGFAGFRVHAAVNSPNYKDELVAFLGASYFRALGKGQRYGGSARGLAIDTATASGEEFPRFVEFWIERPSPSARELTIYALLDSPRTTGAYRFVLRAGDDTVMDIRARLFAREAIGKLGLAPLTSMYFFGENQRSAREDYRPEVHDSDGLSIWSGSGEWLWRPLVDPKRLLVTSFSMTNPKGFGLMQRDRRFQDYEDLEARYELRPSMWVEPKGNWGPGRVELVQIPTPDETNDNIVAFWVPDAPPQPHEAYDFEYRLLWQKNAERKPPASWVSQTRRGFGHLDASVASGPARERLGTALTVDFEGPALKDVDDAALGASVWADANGQLLESRVQRNEATGGARVYLRVHRNDDQKPVELRAYLKDGDNAVSETWSYILPPD